MHTNCYKLLLTIFVDEVQMQSDFFDGIFISIFHVTSAFSKSTWSTSAVSAKKLASVSSGLQSQSDRNLTYKPTETPDCLFWVVMKSKLRSRWGSQVVADLEDFELRLALFLHATLNLITTIFTQQLTLECLQLLNLKDFTARLTPRIAHVHD